MDETETALTAARQNLATSETDAKDIQAQLTASREREQQLRREYLALSDSVADTARAMTEQQYAILFIALMVSLMINDAWMV